MNGKKHGQVRSPLVFLSDKPVVLWLAVFERFSVIRPPFTNKPCFGSFSKGVFTLKDGTSYEGSFVEGEMEGQGLKRWPDGSTCSGTFHLGEIEGHGVQILSSGEKYEGGWLQNRRHGQGELTYANGDVYTGAFRNHKPNGAGVMVLTVGGNEAYLETGPPTTDTASPEGSCRLEGNWQNGLLHGDGSCEYYLHEHGLAEVLEEKYVGSFREGKRHGEEGAFQCPLAPFSYNGPWEEDVACEMGTAFRLLASSTLSEDEQGALNAMLRGNSLDSPWTPKR